MQLHPSSSSQDVEGHESAGKQEVLGGTLRESLHNLKKDSVHLLEGNVASSNKLKLSVLLCGGMIEPAEIDYEYFRHSFLTVRNDGWPDATRNTAFAGGALMTPDPPMSLQRARLARYEI